MQKKTVGRRVFNIFNVAFMAAFCVMILYPYLNVLAIALNDNNATVGGGLMLLPRKFTTMNFMALLSDSGILRSAAITLARIFTGVPYSVGIAFFAAYALTKKYLPGRRAIIFILLIPNYISGGLIPTYILYAKIGLLNNPLVYILPTGFGFFGFILLRTYMYTIPDSLEESAKLDGAGDYTIMFRIFLPLCTPIIATLILFAAVAHWNDWVTTLYFVTNSRWNTLAYELRRILSEQERISRLVQHAIQSGQAPRASPGTSAGVRNAQIILTTLPIILLYPFCQKYFIQGMLVGGVKE
jgi:putative aldouronate transport system permease protein